MNSLKNKVPLIVVADIGGSHISCGVYQVDGSLLIDGSITRECIDSCGSAESILASFVSTMSASAALVGTTVAALAIAMPGPFDYDNGISYIKGLNKYEALYGYDLKQYFASYFKIDADLVSFRNDAESIIAGEVANSKSKIRNGILGLTLGTGFGSAVSYHGETKDVDFGAEPFLDGIADEYFSTRWFIRRYWELSGINVNGVMGLIEEKNTKLVKEVFLEFSKNLVFFLQPKLKEPKINELILCGNIAKAHRYFLPYLAESFKDVTITIGHLGEKAAMIGAAKNFQSSKFLDITP